MTSCPCGSLAPDGASVQDSNKAICHRGALAEFHAGKDENFFPVMRDL